jgi:hypothetical protein
MKRVGAGQVLKVSTLTSTVLALRRIGLSSFASAEPMPEREKTLSNLARRRFATHCRIQGTVREVLAIVSKLGRDRRATQGFTVEQIVLSRTGGDEFMVAGGRDHVV